MAEQSPLVVHHLNHSRSQRVLWLLEELGVTYELRKYERDPNMRAPAALREVHALGKSPVITDQGRTVAESGAIIEYVVRKYGHGRLAPPPDSSAQVDYTYFLHYAEGSLMPLLLLSLIFNRLPKGPMPFFVRPVAKAISARAKGVLVEPELKRHLDFLESTLTKSAWFAGDEFTAADIQMSFPVEAAAARAGLDASRPKLWAFLQRIHARPAYQRALERGGPFELMR
jgi:glutathione S-transferase